MNEILVFFPIVSIFAFNAFCMLPSSFGPPPPTNVEFSECLFVPKITGGAFSTGLYSYRHICRQKFPDNGSQQPQREQIWYFVGRLVKDFGTPMLNLPKFDYEPIEQSLIKLISLKDTMVEFVTGPLGPIFQITFQSLQQRNSFYGMIYHGVSLIAAAPNKIGTLHEMIKDQGFRKIGRNVGALRETIRHFWHITFKNELGEPLLIFRVTNAAIMRVKRSENDRVQLLLQMEETYYILTFCNCDEARKFSDALVDVTTLYMKYVPTDIKTRFKDKKITIDSQDVL